MSLFRSNWTAEDADRWTRHDFLACLFGVLAFVLVTLGVAGSLLLQPWGFVSLALSVLFTWLTFRVIDPKLRALSRGFEEKQAGYLETIERHNRWES
jgi:peptidoglycan/LPS O-acetylase OafA/YrhL